MGGGELDPLWSHWVKASEPHCTQGQSQLPLPSLEQTCFHFQER